MQVCLRKDDKQDKRHNKDQGKELEDDGEG